VKPPVLADAIVDVTETGSSLRANQLRVIDVLQESTPRLDRPSPGARSTNGSAASSSACCMLLRRGDRGVDACGPVDERVRRRR
jgi:hypothetical protein